LLSGEDDPGRNRGERGETAAGESAGYIVELMRREIIA